MNLDFGYFVEVKVIRISVEMSGFASKIRVLFSFFFFPNIDMRCPEHIFSKILSNLNEFSQTW